MRGRTEVYILVAVILAVIGVGYYYVSTPGGGSGLPGVLASDTKFEPLDIRDPGLRVDLLEKIHKLVYEGSQRNIFVSTPLPPPVQPGKQNEVHAPVVIGPRFVPDPPVQVPAEFFGYASQPHGGRRVAFFTSGDDVLVVGEGETFLGRFRLDRINNDNADVEEISSKRHATVPLVQPPQPGGNQ